MKNTNKILVIGDNEKAPYHQLSAVEKQFSSILEKLCELDFMTEYNEMDYNTLKAYDAVVSYTDCWEIDLKTEFTTALISYVLGGGSFLIIHNGISLQNKYEIAQMMGAKFITHPTRTDIRYTDFNSEHPITKGIAEFELYEEPYRFEFDPFTKKTVLFHYNYMDKKYIAAWAHEYGLGKVVYLSPGHDSMIFSCENYQEIIRNSMNWLIK